MTLVQGPVLPLLVVLWPLILGAVAAVPAVRPRALWLLPAAPIPALALALLGADARTEIPDLLLGTVLFADESSRLLLGASAAVWLAAGIFALAYMDWSRKPAVLTGFWCLTLAGNLAVFVTADVVSFYVAFATVSLSSYFLIVHDGTRSALHAGRIYIALAVLGEACLLVAFMIAIAAADSLLIVDLRAQFGAGVAMLLLVVGFGIKAGLMPLHVWLPLAHPAAPTPASAALSGAIVTAGIGGLLVFLPEPGGGWLMALGFTGAFLGALLGLTQSNPKTVLAYSTVSQMSLVVALVAAGSGAAAYYAAHHGLAKGALFLAVGLVAAAGRWRAAALAGTALVALSVAGLPLTGGALAKSAAKHELGAVGAMALELSAITTTLVLARFLQVLRRSQPADAAGSLALVVPTAALALAALVLPWLLWSDWTELPRSYPLGVGALRDGSWPIALGLAIFVAGSRINRRLTLPAGDIVIFGEAAARAIIDASSRRRSGLDLLSRASRARIRRAATAVSAAADRTERQLIRWPSAGLVLLIFVLFSSLALFR